MSFHKISITKITKSLCNAMNIEAPKHAEKSITKLDEYVSYKTNKKGVDKIVIYNPDAIASFLVDKYPHLFTNFSENSEMVLPMLSVVPPKTPVCFATIYSGATPEVHGIQKYVKVKLTIDTYFDALVRAGKTCAIVTVKNQSMDILFRGRDIDYFALANDKEVVDKSIELINSDKYDVIVIYNQEYDDKMHRSFTTCKWALNALKHYNESYGRIINAVSSAYKNYDTLVGAITDHGVHTSKFILGTHGKNIEKDMNILHFYKVINKIKEDENV